MHEATHKADTLVQAIRYIKQFENKIVVIKYGGNAMEDPCMKDLVFEDIAMLSTMGMQIVVVHGGGPDIDREMNKQGLKKQTVDGLRVTDAQTLDIVEKVLAEVNEDCRTHLKNHGVEAMDCTEGSLISEILDERLGFVGRVKKVDTGQIDQVLENGMVPVLSCIGRDETGQLLNINADTAAAKIAEALNAEKLTILTDVDAVMDAEGKRISHLSAAQADSYITDGVISKGMIPKVQACIEAASHGVKKAHLLNGMTPRALLLEIFTEQGVGTEVVKS